MSPFTPKGERARWQVLYDLLRDLPVGDTLTYKRMGVALALDPELDRHTMQLAMRRAARELEKVDKRAVDSITNVGYRIVEPEQHAGLAKRHQRKSHRSLERGQSKVVNVDFNGMEPDTRRAIELMASAFASQLEFNRRMDVRQANLERAVEAVSSQADERAGRTEAELAELRERLRRLEEKTSGSE
jgi:hypothetical protein